MNVTLLLHSATGNTRIVARDAVARLREAGHVARLHDVVHDGEPQLDACELLVVACPTMYFRPTLVMERAVERLPRLTGGPRPAALLATAGGMPGAHFEILAELLRARGWVALEAHWVQCVDSWPPHRVATRPVRPALPVVRAIERRVPAVRWYLHWLWPDVGEPDRAARDGLESFVERIARSARCFDPARTPAPERLCNAPAFSRRLGRSVTGDKMQLITAISLDSRRCSRCGTCAQVCPTGCFVVAAEGQVPTLHSAACTGCWACFQHCPTGAISGFAAPRGLGRYPGPSRRMRALFAPRGPTAPGEDPFGAP